MKKWEGEVIVLGVSAKSILLSYENEDAWIPFSEIISGSEIDEDSGIGDVGLLIIPKWLARKEGWD
jgi:hypothetical protein